MKMINLWVLRNLIREFKLFFYLYRDFDLDFISLFFEKFYVRIFYTLTKTQTINEKSINSKGFYFELLFNELFLTSEKFKKFFLKKLSNQIFIRFPKNCSAKLDWKNKNEEQFKPFDFELDIKHNNLNYKYLIDIKYRTNKNEFSEKSYLDNLIKAIFEENSTSEKKCFFIYLLWFPNFYSFNSKKSNFIDFEIIKSKFNVN